MYTTTASMTITECSLKSSVLKKTQPYLVCMPEGPAPAGGWPLLLFLHGNGRDHRSIVDDEAGLAALAQRKLAIVFPNGVGGWYIDSPVTPASRCQAAVKELLDHVRRTLPVQSAPARTGICGWSMGGFGAVRFAEDYPEDVSAVASAIGLLDFPNPELPTACNHEIPPVMGDDPAEWARINCLSGANKLQGKHLLFIAATEAFDYRMNRNFTAWLSMLGIRHQVYELSGGHTFAVVRESVPLMLDFMETHLKEAAGEDA